MDLKFVLIFIISCLVTCNLAASLSSLQRNDTADDSLTEKEEERPKMRQMEDRNKTGEALEKIKEMFKRGNSTEIQEFFKAPIPDEVQDAINERSLNSIFKPGCNQPICVDIGHLMRERSFIKENKEDLISDLLGQIITTLITDRSHSTSIFLLSENELQYTEIGVAVTKLLMNLKTMEKVDKVMMNVTLNLVNRGLTRLKEPLKFTFTMLDHEMKIDEVLGNEYKKLVKDARQTVKSDDLIMRGPLAEGYSFFLDNITETKTTKIASQNMIKSLTNYWFLKLSIADCSLISDSTSYRYCLLAKAMVKVAIASPGSESTVNDVYQKALAKFVEETNSKSGSKFVDVLKKELKLVPSLYKEFEVILKKI